MILVPVSYNIFTVQERREVFMTTYILYGFALVTQAAKERARTPEA